MTNYGVKLMCELRSANELVSQARWSDENDYGFVSISDHFHPWLPEHDHSPFAWSVLGAIAATTDRVQIITGVTCPIVRYHPVIIAQAAATMSDMSNGRFTLGLGAGERLNEHVTGANFPAVDVRHAMLAEAIEIMQLLWTGEFVTHRGNHFDVDHAKIYDIHDDGVPVVMAVSGDQSLDLASDVGAAGIMATEPIADLVTGWSSRGGSADSTWAEVPLAWASSEQEGIELARLFRFGTQGWDVASELPNPANFAAATQFMTDDQIGAEVPHGPDPQPYVEAIRAFADAGFEQVALVPIGDFAATMEFFQREVRPLLG